MSIEKSRLSLSSITAILILLLFVGCGDDDDPVGPVTPTSLTDIDGNVYQIVVIGEQTWMAENLKVTHYRNGDAIAYATHYTTWVTQTGGAYCAYTNDNEMITTYGLLYNWFAVNDSRKIAPVGWHVPTDAELKQLEVALGMSSEEADLEGFRGTNEGDKLKETGTDHWYEPNLGATDSVGFVALPGGSRSGVNGAFGNLWYGCYYWTSTEGNSGLAWMRRLYHNKADLYRYGTYQVAGLSVRCVKD